MHILSICCSTFLAARMLGQQREHSGGDMSISEPYGAAAERPPTISRRHAAGAASARGLLFTVLGEFVLGTGVAWTSTLIEVLGGLGVEDKTTRQALMRTAADGWLSAERVGRRTRWHLTGDAEQMLTDGAQRIYSFTGAADDWDGRWLLVSARVPESDRRARHMLRSRLAWAGFGSLAPGLWISPHPDREAEATKVLRVAGLAGDGHVFIATRPGVGDVVAMVQQAWDLDAIEDEYEEFLEEFAANRSGTLLTRQIELVHSWRRFPAIDPALPRELLPAHWSGVKAATLFARRHAQWAAGARAEWLTLNAAAD
jgi:phenylacetic acid degradation operon negative regulatory protein